MKSSSSPEKPDRFFLSRRFLALAAVSLLAIGLALLAVLMDRGSRSARFDELREGMTMGEVLEVLKPAYIAQLPPNNGAVTVTTMEQFRAPALTDAVFFGYSESPLFPLFKTTITIEKGHLTTKELHSPSIHDILAYWWRKGWERAGM
jgi:hypothetical protein